MVSALTVIVLLCILIPAVPLGLYCIGLLLPSSHIVSRSHTFKTTPTILWSILTNVEDYPSWRPNIDKVTIETKQERITFVEYSKKNRRTVVVHIEQEHEKKLLRVLEERSTLGEESAPRTRNSTFSGSWAFTIEPVEDASVILRITEQGVIKKPMVRVSHILFFGYHRRIDQFMKDLGKRLDTLSE